MSGASPAYRRRLHPEDPPTLTVRHVRRGAQLELVDTAAESSYPDLSGAVAGAVSTNSKRARNRASHGFSVGLFYEGDASTAADESRSRRLVHMISATCAYDLGGLHI